MNVRSSYSLIDITSSPVTSSNANNDDDDPPPPVPIHLPVPSAPTTPQLPQQVHFTRETNGDISGDPIDQLWTHSQFQISFSQLAQVSEDYDFDTFVESSGHQEWDATMKEEYHSLLSNDT